jgi:glycosyltransferase involved in cell wall biosynthesis
MYEKQDITLCTYFKSNISVPKQITLFGGNGSLPGFFRVLKAALDDREYDIIHAHTPHVGVLFLAANIIYGRSIRSTVCTVHNSYQSFKTRNRLLLVFIFAFFQRVVLCSNAGFVSFPALYRWLGGDRISVIQNGMDIDRVDRVVDNYTGYRQKDGFKIAAVGRLTEIKNPIAILRAFEQCDDQISNLIFIGEGHLRELLIKEIEERNLGKRVKLTGLIPREQVYERLIEADLLVSASRGEGLPIAVLEAMACRCPVILSDIPPHREIAEGADFIPLILPDDIMGLAQEIRRLRLMSAAERAAIGEKCKKLVEERFSLEAMHERYAEIYSRVLGE